MCTSLAPASRTIWTIFWDVVPRTIESSTSTTRLPSIIRRLALCLSLTPMWRIEFVGLDEGSPDIMIADDAELEGHARSLREADRRRRAGIGHRHDDVGIDRDFRRRAPRRCAFARRRRCGPRRWNRAARNRRTRRCRSVTSAARRETALSMPLAVTTTISPGFRSRTKRAPMMSSAQVSDAEDPGAVEIAEHQRADAERVAAADHLLGGERHQREGAFDLAHGLDEARIDVALAAGRDQMQDRLGVGGRREDRALLLQRALDGHGIGDVAVMGDCQPALGQSRRTAAACCAAPTPPVVA